jgi:hypothetical protein
MFQLGDFTGAIRDFTSAAEIDPTDKNVFFTEERQKTMLVKMKALSVISVKPLSWIARLRRYT